jgi:putative ABC transport system substrate-binding protein
MRRRQFITLLGGAVAWPLPVSAQQTPKLPTIGSLSPMTASVENQRVAAFVQRLRAVGWIEGRAAAIKVRWAEGRSERAAEIVAEFVREKVDVVVAGGAASVLAAKQATPVIPIVFAGGDPVGTGFVVSLARPGWQYHGPIVPADRSCWQTTRTLARGCPSSSPVSDFGQCRQSCHPPGYA